MDPRETSHGHVPKASDSGAHEARTWILSARAAESRGLSQNRQGYYWSEEEVFTKLNDIIVPAFHSMYKLAKEKKLAMRTAAFVNAVQRIVSAIEAKGTEDQYRVK